MGLPTRRSFPNQWYFPPMATWQNPFSGVHGSLPEDPVIVPHSLTLIGCFHQSSASSMLNNSEAFREAFCAT